MIKKYGLELKDMKPVLIEEAVYPYEGKHLITAEAVVSLVNKVFRLKFKAEEIVYMCAYNAHMDLIAVFEISHGTATASLISPREVGIRALLSGAIGIMIIHSHPSGDVTPSNEDEIIFLKVIKSMRILGVELLDFLIVGNPNYFSFREHNMCNAWE
ncbi:JAB domain-containing protein [Dorea longicatena]|uniref:JAB domain-containing protein n=1 Tax=Dorea longicatena TaxID=88431 RepID=UPI00156F15C6|nr:JAB domain-containing protein [Dorea longicatena]NSD68971.1 DNA repair protein RadC [Dorea longicatena]